MGRIVLNKVSKSFGETLVIPPLDLTIEDGDFTVFVGPSGCGKSTLLRMIAGLEELTSGDIEINDKDVTQVSPSKRGLAMVFQSYALYPHMTVRKNIGFPLRMQKMAPAEIDKRVQNAAASLNLVDYLDRKPGQLSGGQRQRLGLARGLYRNPNIIFLDEATNALDPVSEKNLLHKIKNRYPEMSVVLISHNKDNYNLCDNLYDLTKQR